MGLFDHNLLTGHVRILTRRERARLASPIDPQGGQPGQMKEAGVLVVYDGYGNLIVDEDVQLTDERYIVVQIVDPKPLAENDGATDIGVTFDLATLWPNGLPEGISYYLIDNQSGMDINIVLSAGPLRRPLDTVVKNGSSREASLYVCETGRVLTISDELMAY